MDEQILERAALLQRKVLRLEQDNTELRRRLAKRVPLGSSATSTVVATDEEIQFRTDRIEAGMDPLPDALVEFADERRRDETQYVELREDWEAERREVQRLQTLVGRQRAEIAGLHKAREEADQGAARLKRELEVMARRHAVASQDHEDSERDVDRWEGRIRELERRMTDYYGPG